MPSCIKRGEWGIRTPEGLHPTRFPSARHRPLGEFSWIKTLLLVREFIDTSGGLAHRVGITCRLARSSLGEFSWDFARC